MKTAYSWIALGAMVALGMVWWMVPSDVTTVVPSPRSQSPVPAQPAVISSGSKIPPAPSIVLSAPADLAKPDPELELQHQCRAVLALANATERMAAFEKLLAATTSKAGIKGILQALIEIRKTGRNFDSEWGKFWHVVGHRDPKAAIAMAESYGPGEKWYPGAVWIAIQEWAGLDPQAAMKWLDGNQSLTGNALDGATLNLIHGYATRDLKAATDYALKIIRTDDPIFGDAAYALTRSALEQGGTAGLFSWFDALPSDALRERLFGSIASRLYELDPEQQRAWLAAQASKPYRNDDTYRNMIGGWAQNDPRAAMDFAVQLPLSPQSHTYVGLAYAAYEWLVKDPEGFNSYFQTLPPGDLRTGMINAIKGPLADKNFPNKKREPAVKFLEGVK